ncbi:type VI secretion system tip protein VgrG [Photobacterium lipolyticum]|uniref:Type VI secretion system tip protein VgrG n=1 Tax=Photobacterium lipolyticum TaxID=266810 RepID=A0A2T3N1B7_9GAMM|nr:type VI secretion system tip protein VgrG [Photobacterium lipolyticum]PSW06093.1 type VI secretion system tip protein VgrG [Photobacterium lipolyticum]
MARNANQAQFELDVATIDLPLRLYAFEGQEGISQLFNFSVIFVCDDPALQLDSWLQLPVRLALYHNNGLEPRFVCGMVYGIEQLTHSDRHCQYRLTITPRVQLLTHRTNFRIFQNQSVSDIITTIFTDAGILSHEYEQRLSNSFPVREYCVQYGESDMLFIARLMSEEGLHYHFEHTETGHVMVIADGQDGFLELPALPYRQSHGMAKDRDIIHHFALLEQTQTGKVSLTDFTFERPDFRPQGLKVSNISNEQPLEAFHYPGQFTTDADGTRIATLTLEQARIHKQRVTGKSDCTQLTSGYFQPLEAHPNDQWNEPWLLVEVKHQGKQPQALEEYADGAATYNADFIATPWEAAFRAEPITKPYIHNIDTAIVTGPAGEEIYCDALGRVKVQFHWDREGQANETTSCWLRVSQGWAGNGYGQFVLPRIGHEVIVSFIHGDPDKPIITGAMFNGKNKVPYDLPEHKTRSTFKTSSSVGGGNFNELRFEDKKDNEQLYLHAAKNMDVQVENDRKDEILNADHLTVHDSRFQEVKVDNHSTVNGDQFEAVKGDSHHIIDGTVHTKIGNKQLIEAGTEVHVKSGQKVVIEAGAEITIKAGGSFIKVDPSGVTLLGPTVKMNSGGSAGRGSGAAAQAAQLPVLSQKAPDANVSAPVGITSSSITALAAVNAPFSQICKKQTDGSCPLSDCPCTNSAGNGGAAS